MRKKREAAALLVEIPHKPPYLDSMVSNEPLSMTPEGLFCPRGGFHIDPIRPVPKALITHGHSDHARAGHGAVLATEPTIEVMRIRYGEAFAGAAQAIAYGERLALDGSYVTFQPAGHVLGSAQILIETKGRRIVASGDYKRTKDPTCAPFEPIRCDVFVSEATFGLPVFRHTDVGGEIGKLLDSTKIFPERGHLVGAYALGKAQRIAALLRCAGWERPLYVHGAMEKMMDLYERFGIRLGEIRKVSEADRRTLGGEIVICPPGAMNDLWSRKFPDPVCAFASGWMRVRARARQRGVDLPLAISDHADWDELCQTIKDTECKEVWVTHGAEEALVYWSQQQGLSARPLHMLGYGDEEDDSPEGEGE